MSQNWKVHNREFAVNMSMTLQLAVTGITISDPVSAAT